MGGALKRYACYIHVLFLKFLIFSLLSFVLIEVVSFFSSKYFILLNDQYMLLLTIVLIAYTVVSLFITGYGLVLTIRYLLNPLKNLFGDLQPFSGKKEITSFILRISKEKGIQPPTLFETHSQIPNVCAFGFKRENTALIFSHDLKQHIDDEEMESIILHEFYHIMRDVEPYSFDLFARKTIDVPYSSIRFMVYVTILGTLWIVMQWVRPSYMYIQSKYTTIASLKMELFILSILLIISIIYIAISIIWVLKIGTFISRQSHTYTREMFADSYSAINNQKPMKLYSAIVKCARTKWFKDIRTKEKSNYLDKISFVHPRERYEKTKDLSLSDIFKTKKINTLTLLGMSEKESSYPFKYRLSHIKMLHQLIHKNSYVEFLVDTIFEIPRSTLRKTPKIIYDLLGQKRESFNKFLTYIIEKKSEFNLMKCSESLKMDPFETYLMLFAAVNSGILDIRHNNKSLIPT